MQSSSKPASAATAYTNILTNFRGNDDEFTHTIPLTRKRTRGVCTAYNDDHMEGRMREQRDDINVLSSPSTFFLNDDDNSISMSRTTSNSSHLSSTYTADTSVHDEDFLDKEEEEESGEEEEGGEMDKAQSEDQDWDEDEDEVRPKRKSKVKQNSKPRIRGKPNGRKRKALGGDDIWSAEVTAAFMTSLELIPRLGRKKVAVDGRPCGRNEMISWYIERVTGMVRTRKQVSSHIQVLKHLHADDPVLTELELTPTLPFIHRLTPVLELVDEPLNGTDVFAPGNKSKFFGREEGYVSEEGRPAIKAKRVRKSSGTSRKRMKRTSVSPGLCSVIEDEVSLPAATFSTSKSLPTLLPRLPALPPLPSTRSINDNSPSVLTRYDPEIATESFVLYADAVEGPGRHIFARINDDAASVGMRTVLLEQLVDSAERFPGLAEMATSVPCPFLHFDVNLDIPSSPPTSSSVKGKEKDVEEQKLGALKLRFELMSEIDTALLVVTSIYSFGERLLSLEDRMDAPIELDPTASSSSTSTRRNYIHTPPFSLAFFSTFLQGFNLDGKNGEILKDVFTKNESELEEFAQAITGITVVQEFIRTRPVISDPSHSQASVDTGIQGVSESGIGSEEEGETVLVIAYEFKSVVDEFQPKGSINVGWLSTRGREELLKRVVEFQRRARAEAISFSGATSNPASIRDRSNPQQAPIPYHYQQRSHPSTALSSPTVNLIKSVTEHRISPSLVAPLPLYSLAESTLPSPVMIIDTGMGLSPSLPNDISHFHHESPFIWDTVASPIISSSPASMAMERFASLPQGTASSIGLGMNWNYQLSDTPVSVGEFLAAGEGVGMMTRTNSSLSAHHHALVSSV